MTTPTWTVGVAYRTRGGRKATCRQLPKEGASYLVFEVVVDPKNKSTFLLYAFADGSVRRGPNGKGTEVHGNDVIELWTTPAKTSL